MALAPLDDPTYEPVHRPVDGRPPAVIARWGAASQLRWFSRFHAELAPMPEVAWSPFFCSSSEHRGLCCDSCLDDNDNGFYYTDSCCCRAPR